MRVPSLLLILFLASMAWTQEVREESPIGNGASTFRRAARDSGADWPVFGDGDKGTSVRITFDPRNTDVVVSTQKAFGEARLLDTMKRLAVELGMPKGDFIVYPYPTSVSIDLEMNDYLRFPQKGRTEFEMPVGKIVRFLEANGLSRPIDVGIEGLDADTAALVQHGQPDRSIAAIDFFSSREIADDAIVRYRGSVSPFGYIVLVLMAAAFTGFLIFPWRIFLKARPAVEEVAEPKVKTPDEVQREYDRKKPRLQLLWPLLLLFPALLMDSPAVHKAFASGMTMMPPLLIHQMLPIFFGVGLVNMLAAFSVFRMRRTKRGPLPVTPELAQGKRFGKAMLPLAFGFGWVMLCMIVMSTWSGFNRLGLSGFGLRAVIMGPVLLALAASVVLMIRATKGERKRLAPGDLWFDRTQELAAKVGVKVRHVIIRQSPVVNAYANLFHDVGLTSGLLEKMEPDETESVIAHELGHHRRNDVRKMLLASLIFLLGIILFFNYPFDMIADHFHWSPSTRNILSGPLVFFFLVPFLQSLVFGKARRKHEHSADAFAAWAVGDKEVVIRALTKMTQINQSPARLKPIDEVLSSHPSLVNRIEALRRLDLGAFDPGTSKTL